MIKGELLWKGKLPLLDGQPTTSISRWADWDIGTIRAEQIPLWYSIRGTYIALKNNGETCLRGSFVVEILMLMTLFKKKKKKKKNEIKCALL